MVEANAKGAIDVGSTVAGRFELLSCIGKGGMGIVYKARVHQSDKIIALKLLFLERVPDLQSIARFQQEARAASLLDHPNLAKVYEYGVAESGQPYLVMDLIEGTTLAAKIEKEAQLSIEETLKIFILVCDGLAYAHAHQILHRDLKPSNFMLTACGDDSFDVKILDFGLAKFQKSTNEESHYITHAGELIGSPLYMSPEQARGIEIDERSDLYSLGCALYESLTGVPPHIGRSPISTLLKKETDQPLPLSEGSLGRRFSKDAEEIVSKLLNIDPTLRFQSALEVKEALIELLNAKAISDSTASHALPAKSLQTGPAKPASNRSVKSILIVGLTVFTIGLVGTPIFYYSINNQLFLKSPQTTSQSILNRVDKSSFSWNANVVIGKAQLLKGEKKYDEAAQTYREAIGEYRSHLGPNSTDEADAYEELADTYISAHRENDAYDALQNALRIVNNLPCYDDLRLPNLLQLLGKIYENQFQSGRIKNPDTAVELLQQAAGLYERSSFGKNLDAARCLTEAGGLLAARGRTSEAEKLLLHAIPIFNKQRCTPNWPAQAYRWLSHCYRSEQRYSDALECDSKGVALIDRTNPLQRLNLCNHLNTMGGDTWLLAAQNYDTNQIKTAESALFRSLELSNRNPEEMREQRIVAFDGLGRLYSTSFRHHEPGAYQNAKRYLLEALKLNQLSPDIGKNWTGVRYEILARLEADSMHPQKCLEYVDLALKYPGERTTKIVNNSLTLLTVIRPKDNPAFAEALCKQLLVSSKHQLGTDSIAYADVCSELGQLYLAKNQRGTAKVYLSKALSIYAKQLGPAQDKASFIGKLLSSFN